MVLFMCSTMPSFLGQGNLHDEPSVKRWLASEGEKKARKRQSLLVGLSNDMVSVQFSELILAPVSNFKAYCSSQLSK